MLQGRLRNIALLASLLILAVGCGNNSNSSSSASSSTHYMIKIGSAEPDGAPDAEAMKGFLAEIEKNSGGRLTGQLYVNSQLGNTAALVQGAEQNTIQMNYTSTSSLTGPVPQFAALSLPFLFNSTDSLVTIVNGPIGAQLNQSLNSNAGLQILGWFLQGGTAWGTTNKPLLTLSDMKGQKMRIAASAITLDSYKAWGGVPLTIDATEILTALKQGTVQGLETSLTSIYSFGWYQAIKYLTLSYAVQVSAPLFINAKFFRGLPSDLQRIVMQAAANAVKTANAAVVQSATKIQGQIAAAGVKVSPLSTAAAAEFRAAAQPAYANAATSYGPRFVSDLVAAAATANSASTPKS